MAERENIDPIEERKRGGVWRLYSSEVVAALVIIVLVIGIAFFVNMFFYGFDLPELAFSEPVVSDTYADSGPMQTRDLAKKRRVLFSRRTGDCSLSTGIIRLKRNSTGNSLNSATERWSTAGSTRIYRRCSTR